ncbi:MAG: hypothetical protein WCA77_02600, partial [Thermoplasmata archaeon]
GRVLSSPDFDPSTALDFLDKGQLQDLCEEAELDEGGTRDTLIDRVARKLREEKGAAAPRREVDPARPPPPPEYSPPPTAPRAAEPGPERLSRREQVFVRQPPAPEPLFLPHQQSPTLIPETHAAQIPQLQLVQEFIESYRPSRRFANEQAYEIEMAQAARAKFGDEAVKTQVTIFGGRIDIEVLGIGIEIKVPNSRSQLQTLLGQVQIYRNSYGPNLMVVIFQDLGKQQDLHEFGNLLRQWAIPVFVK